ncbi:efflux RND transporter periplasmic adaptor subunit [Roseiterribacter gracilis]|uniref:RND transporter MFP subunit n=1 Tax=Roseiterribacter gracilis TaxID=2812848 RepID=A0A8S8X8B0_9PROT|nr:RND transporter MFP subunit [Rhodospirillales bacterium TMPK1]
MTAPLDPNRPPSWLKRQAKGHTRLLLTVAVVIVALVVVSGIASRLLNARALKVQTAARAVQSVTVTTAKLGPREEELVLPGNVQARSEAPIYARTSGYLKAWYVDLGTRVKAGQLLAEIETPEVDEQLRQAEADLNTIEATSQLAQSTAARWRDLLAKGTVSQQAADEKNADANAKRAQLQSARANRERLLQLQGFKRVVAPFDGVISSRRTDVGQLIAAGSGVGPELFHLVDSSTLRIYVQVPQPFTPVLKVGTEAGLRFAERPGRNFPATLVRMADALDANSRSLMVELEYDNRAGELLPGSYAEVHFHLKNASPSPRVPATALLFGANGQRIAKVASDGKVTLQKVAIGRDFGNEVEIVEGLAADEPFALDPPDSLTDGQVVRVAKPETPKPPEPRAAER